MATPAQPSARKSQFAVLAAVGIVVVVLGLGLPRLFGNPPAPVAADLTQPEAPNLTYILGRLILGLLLVAGFCFSVAKFANYRKAIGVVSPGAVEMLAALPVDARSHLFLLKAGRRRLLVGLDPGGVKSMVELPGVPPELPSATPTVISAHIPATR